MSEMKLIMENFRRFSEQVCTGGACEREVPKTSSNELEGYLNQLNKQYLEAKKSNDKDAMEALGFEINRIKKELGTPPVKEQAGEPPQGPALKQPLDIGQAAVSVGGLSMEAGYLYYTIDGKRPMSASDIGKLANPGSVLRHHFKEGSDLNRMTNIVNQAQQGRAIKSVTSQRAHPARAFFEAGLAFRMSPDIKNNAVKLVVSEAPHLKRKEGAPVAPGLPPQR